MDHKNELEFLRQEVRLLRILLEHEQTVARTEAAMRKEVGEQLMEQKHISRSLAERILESSPMSHQRRSHHEPPTNAR